MNLRLLHRALTGNIFRETHIILKPSQRSCLSSASQARLGKGLFLSGITNLQLSLSILPSSLRLQVDEDLCRNPPTEVSHNQPVLTSHHPIQLQVDEDLCRNPTATS
uniref:Uncharacterized protein n=1 Tax=Timema cristinae TaxID=61476 RepID=A0A7R9C9S5_TIMCR|nr:unnamed protein product [Timema cristinae]